MIANLWSSYGLVFSQPVLLALVSAGLSRDEAYRIVQSAASDRMGTERRSFHEILLENPEVMSHAAGALEEAFDLSRALRHAGKSVDVLGSDCKLS
jgi:adenylosuccinate lyase